MQSRSGSGESGMSKLLQKSGEKATQETAVTNSIDYEQLIVSFVKNEISYDQIMEVIHTDVSIICKN